MYDGEEQTKLEQMTRWLMNENSWERIDLEDWTFADVESEYLYQGGPEIVSA